MATLRTLFRLRPWVRGKHTLSSKSVRIAERVDGAPKAPVVKPKRLAPGFAKVNSKGEWECVNLDCLQVNVLGRTVCFSCKTPRPGTEEDWNKNKEDKSLVLRGTSDWMCVTCATRNFAFRKKCWRCQCRRQLAAGEWWCPACGIHNYRSNFKCFSCKAPRRSQSRPRYVRGPRGEKLKSGVAPKTSTIQG